VLAVHARSFGLIATVTDNYLNIASQVNRGLDLTVAYGQDLPWNTRLNVDLQSTWQFKDTTALFADTVVDSNGFVGDPDWTGKLNFRLTKGEWTAFWGVDMIGKASDAESYADSNAAKTTFYKIHTEFTAYHNVSLQKKFDEWTLLGGVANLFNEEPPQVTQNAGNYNMTGRSVLASQYDYIGRRVFLSMTGQVLGRLGPGSANAGKAFRDFPERSTVSSGGAIRRFSFGGRLLVNAIIRGKPDNLDEIGQQFDRARWRRRSI
jgi:hypothetical protein